MSRRFQFSLIWATTVALQFCLSFWAILDPQMAPWGPTKAAIIWSVVLIDTLVFAVISRFALRFFLKMLP
jgi:hypothetical protein